MKIIILSICLTLILNASLNRSNSYVYDDKNGLIWQDSKDNITLRLSFNEAIKYCENGTFAGKKTWRLPTREDYKHIINKNIKAEHKINKAFKYSMPVDYWIGESTWRSLGRYGYYVFMKSGTIYYDNKSYKKFVRCVR